MGALRTLGEMVGVAVRINAAAVHRQVQGSYASVGVVLVGTEGAADDVLDLSILPLFRLLLPKFLHLGLDSVTEKKLEDIYDLCFVTQTLKRST